ncbi:response regulator receiver protein [Mycobacterium malmoense]|uniref:GAF and ANTAR domain-containing protein n=1 Tax=Mycobacterium malmoense TaxID=1780 RepID=UPI00080B8DCB|nr:GAF and ANTAR domain-containing protein [Mycobacterium malmoense]OCB36199.1 response regulator receiver protein [Mycobacterium malmoense]OCB38352.1 response regulator receiver protein [Mycobacterium malmoense]
MQNGTTVVISQLAELVSSMERAEIDTAAGLNELIGNGVLHVVGSQYAGITMAERTRAVFNVAATHRYPVLLDEIQNRYAEGPCVEAAWRHHVMHVEDLAVEKRWPRYRRYALEQTPIRSILSYELFVDRGNMAALNFYADSPHAFSDDAVELGAVYATHIALAWSMLRRQDQFRSALTSRDMIGQAKGIIMERFNLDAVEAFELLTRLSQKSNTRLIDIAKSLIDSEHPLKRRNR